MVHKIKMHVFQVCTDRLCLVTCFITIAYKHTSVAELFMCI